MHALRKFQTQIVLSVQHIFNYYTWNLIYGDPGVTKQGVPLEYEGCPGSSKASIVNG